MKILHLNTFDSFGGAAKATNRLHQGLLGHEIDSRILVQVKKGGDWRITRPPGRISRISGLFRPFIDSLPLFTSPHREAELFSTATVPDFLLPEIFSISPDIIHLHWINYGFLRLETLKNLPFPIVWTFHDMWPFTGGCHVDKNCGRYIQKCGVCPQLHSKKQRDLSYRIWKRKHNILENINVGVVTPSNWMAECARNSSLFKNRQITVIPNGLNLKSFKPLPKSFARELLNIPNDKTIILFGSINATKDRNKGFHLLQEALLTLKQNKNSDSIEIAIFGADEPKDAPDLGFKAHYFGQLFDETSLASLYSAADVTVVPSLQESFGQTASEALACGCPVVAFNSTGLLDIVDHRTNGYLANLFKPDDLAKGIQWVLKDKNRYAELSAAARQKAIKTYDVHKVASQYINLYEHILNKSS